MHHGSASSRIRLGLPFFPAAVDHGGELEVFSKSYCKSSKFTQSFLTHGRWANNTLDEATNQREREHRLKERTMRKLERMSEKFRWEVHEVERIQSEVRARQQRIARANLCTCCAIMIQTAWRGYQAKILAWERRGARLGIILLRWWRRFRTRRNLDMVRRLIISSVRRRRQRKRRRIVSAVKLQRAWRRWLLRVSLTRVVLATGAIEVLLDNLLLELARQVSFEIKGAAIVRAWKHSRRRKENNRKGCNSRVFLTQGGVSSPRRRGPRAAGGVSRTGVTSDPSSSSSSRRYPSARAGNSGKASGATGITSPAFLGIVSAATSAAEADTSSATGGGENWRRLSHSYNPSRSLAISSPSRKGVTGSPNDAGGACSGRTFSASSASSVNEGEARGDGDRDGDNDDDCDGDGDGEDSGGGSGAEHSGRQESLKLLMTKSLGETVRRGETSKIRTGNISNSGRRSVDVVLDVVDNHNSATKPPSRGDKGDSAAERRRLKDPRRPSSEKPSNASEGRTSRTQKLASNSGGETTSAARMAVEPSLDRSSEKKSHALPTSGRGVSRASSAGTPAEKYPIARSRTSKSSEGRIGPSKRSSEVMTPRGARRNDHDHIAVGGKISVSFVGVKSNEGDVDREEYGSDAFESVEELSIAT